jgi:hypothetical protein
MDRLSIIFREMSHMLKAIHAQESRDAADRKARTIDLHVANMHSR